MNFSRSGFYLGEGLTETADRILRKFNANSIMVFTKQTMIEKIKLLCSY